ncbi:MAG TPA: hypothetical protein VNL17_14740 [Verrucomicrobiae bacterium]|nr:hypothetical protein [Verrucomicrobiae bacterium]
MTAAAFIAELEAALKETPGAQAVCVGQLQMAKAIALLRAGEAMSDSGPYHVSRLSAWSAWDEAAAMSTEWREVPR